MLPESNPFCIKFMLQSNVNEIMFPGKSLPNKGIDKVPIIDIDGKYPALVINKRSSITILYFHGNRESICDVYESYGTLKESAFNFVSPEYDGYSVRDGQETERGCLEMAESAFRYSLTLGTGIIVIGYSIGSGPATHLCRYYPQDIFGLVLINPFLSIKKLAFERVGIASILVKQRFNNVKNIKEWNGNLITICGKNDNQIEFTHGVMLHAKCPSKYKKIIIHEEEGHELSDWRELIFDPIFDVWFSNNKKTS